MRVPAFFLLLLTLPELGASTTGPSHTEQDPCLVTIPADLQLSLTKKYTTHRLPLSTDSLQIDRAYQVAHGGNGCLRVTTGRFRATTRDDIAVLMTPITPSGETLLIVAWQDGNRSWKSQEIWRCREATSRLFVEGAPSGRYTRTPAVEEPRERGELTSIDSPITGILSGMTDSFGYAFFWRKGKWVHVRVSE